jgi:hypothetical protein
MKTVYRYALPVIIIFLMACSADDGGAQHHLDAARRYYKQNEFTLATQAIDSIRLLYPRAIEQRKAGLVLLDSVRRGENDFIIQACDSLILSFQPVVEDAKKRFVFRQNKEYQESGSYIPKEMATDNISSTLLRSGVAESGQLYIESVFVGSQRHRKLRVSLRDGSFAETLAVTSDGLNYRFSNLGKEYEIIHFADADENGVGRFIFSNSDKPLTVTLEGAGKYSYTLPQTTKSAIARSYELSAIMLRLDSLKTEKEKAEFRNYNLVVGSK